MSNATRIDRAALPLEVIDRIDRICDRFEAAWREGGRPMVEDFLGEVGEEGRSALLHDLLAAELDARRRLGERPGPHDYRDRFAEDTALLDSVFAEAHAVTCGPLDGFEPVASPTQSAHPAAGRDRHDFGRPGPLPNGSGARTDPVGAAGTFVQSLVDSGLMTAEEARAAMGRHAMARRPDDAPGIAEDLARAGLLTAYQAARMARGEAEGLVRGGYEILDEIGRGGMGVVYKARHRRMQRTVALKVLSPATLRSESAVRRFHQEVRAVARLDHPNILRAHDAGEHQGVHYLVTEYVDGADLSQLVQARGPLPVAEALDLALQVARGLEYAHDQGVIHRDIKPRNIMVGRDGTAKILDLGLARVGLPSGADEAGTDHELTRTEEVMGTAGYMAPEQAVSARAADRRSDIYSLGCTLFYLLTGRSPYRGQTTLELLLAHREQAIPSLGDARPDVPPALDATLRRMLAKRPEDRQPSMAAVIRDLEACRAGASSGVDPASGKAEGTGSVWTMQAPDRPRARRWARAVVGMRRSSRLLIALLAILVCGLALVVILQGRERRDASPRPAAAGREPDRGLVGGKPEAPAVPTLTVLVQSGDRTPVAGAYCSLVVGGYPMDEQGRRTAEPIIRKAFTDGSGIARFTDPGLAAKSHHILFVRGSGFADATRSIDRVSGPDDRVTVRLTPKYRITLRYEFQTRPNDVTLEGDGVRRGSVRLYPKEGGTYAPPARAFFSFLKDRRVGGSVELDVGVETDQRDGRIYLGSERGRFDHFTDLGEVDFDSLRRVDTDDLVRKRQDTEAKKGHVLIYESNIYKPSARTDFTGKDVYYAKVLVESIEPADLPTKLALRPEVPAAGRPLTLTYRPGSDGLDGAREIILLWVALDRAGKSLADPASPFEFPDGPGGTGRGTFELGRKRCARTTMRPRAGDEWTCSIDPPPNAHRLALLFVDEIDRTDREGIRMIEIGP